MIGILLVAQGLPHGRFRAPSCAIFASKCCVVSFFLGTFGSRLTPWLALNRLPELEGPGNAFGAVMNRTGATKEKQDAEAEVDPSLERGAGLRINT